MSGDPIAAQQMKNLQLIVFFLFAGCAVLFSRPARAQELPGTTLITNCKPGASVPGYKKPGGSIRTYARFSCGSSVFVWDGTAQVALVQQGTTVAYVPTKYIFDAGTSSKVSPAALRTFLQGIAEGLTSADGSAFAARRQLVESCLAARGCQAEAWSHLAWTRIKRGADMAGFPDATLRLYANGVYYSAFVVNPPVRYKDRALPSLRSPVLVLDGGGLSVAVVDHTCYLLGHNGKWSAAGASAGQSTAAIQ